MFTRTRVSSNCLTVNDVHQRLTMERVEEIVRDALIL